MAELCFKKKSTLHFLKIVIQPYQLSNLGIGPCVFGKVVEQDGKYLFCLEQTILNI